MKQPNDMGVVYAEIELINTDDLAFARRKAIDESEVRRMNVNMLVDSGEYMLSVNETIKEQLGLEKISKEVFELTDGSQEKFDIVGPVDIRFKNRATTVRAVLLPGNAEPLLGAIPMEDMDVVILPRKQIMDVNPESPIIAKKSLK